jgi:hypothetical protein
MSAGDETPAGLGDAPGQAPDAPTQPPATPPSDAPAPEQQTTAPPSDASPQTAPSAAPDAPPFSFPPDLQQQLDEFQDKWSRTQPPGDPVKQCSAKPTGQKTKKKPKAKKAPLWSQDFHDMAMKMVSITENGKPDAYGGVNRKGWASDPGGISYGILQFAEKQGTLAPLLRKYVNSTNPPPDKDLKKQIQDQLGHFDKAGKNYQGTDQQREDFFNTLEKAGNDPAMQKAEQDVADQRYFNPAMNQAAKYGVTSNLGKAMFFDQVVNWGQAGDPPHTYGSADFAKMALDKWNTDNKAKATAAQPKDPHGPDEKTFLQYMNDARLQVTKDKWYDPPPKDRKLTKKEKARRDTYISLSKRPKIFNQLLTDGNLQLNQDFDYDKGYRFYGLGHAKPKDDKLK